MHQLIQDVFTRYVGYLQRLIQDPTTPTPVVAAAGLVLDTYIHAQQTDRIDANSIRLTVNAVAQITDLSDNHKILICQEYLGLFNVYNPRVIWVGTEQNIDPIRQPRKLANLLLECVYLPLLMRYDAMGDAVASIASNQAWANEPVVFFQNPNHYYRVTAPKSTWRRVETVQCLAGQGGLEQAYLTERNLCPAANIGAGAQNYVPNPIAEQAAACLRQTARALIFYADNYPDRSACIATQFLGRQVRSDECVRPRRQSMTYFDHIDPRDRVRRRVIISKHVAWGGLTEDELPDLAALIRGAF